MFALETLTVRCRKPARRSPRGQATSEMLVIAGVVVAILLGVMVAFKGEITQAVGTLSARIQCAVSGASGCGGGTTSLAAPPGTDANAYGLVSGAPGSGSAGGNTATATMTLPPGGGTATGTTGLPPGGGRLGGSPFGTITTGLGDGVDAILNSSTAFQGNGYIISRNGYHVTFGEEGKGSFCNRTKKLIVIDSKWKGNDAVIADILAHEMGHALYNPKHDPIPKMDDPKYADWVLAQVQKSLEDEGEAILKEFQIRESLVAAGQPPIPISGVKSAEYEKIWQQFQQDHDREKARKAIGELVGRYEHPSTAPELTYEEYYTAAWMDASIAQTGLNLSGVR